MTKVHSVAVCMKLIVKPHKRSQMRKTRKCAFCGKEFTCNSGSQRYCSEHCAEAAKAQRKKRQQDFLKAVQPVIDIASQEYLTFSKAAILMGCSRQYVYKLVNEGKLPASRISSRMAFIRKADIENYCCPLKVEKRQNMCPQCR